MTPALIAIHEKLGDRWLAIAKDVKAADAVRVVGWFTYPPVEYGDTHAIIMWRDESIPATEVFGPRDMLPDLVLRTVLEVRGASSN